MCGIVGIAALNGAIPPVADQVRGMCATIAHRGPDDESVDIRNGIGFGMRRLSIIDLAGGRQPIFNEDGTIRVVFNGEIYNFKELRHDLEQRGHHFATHTDTEVIVHAYEAYGMRFVERLNGMFAFALHDSARRRLILARDHLGIKPLFYFLDKNYLIWGSEIKAILASDLVPRELNMNALAEFLTWEYIPGEGTLFQSIHKLMPANILEIDLNDGTSQVFEYWDVPPQISLNGEPRTKNEWLEAIDLKIRECVRRQLISDVPLGAFLSGGVDSSLVVAAMGSAETFSIGFDDPSYNELPWARRVARHLGVNHYDDIIRPIITDLFDHLMYFMDDPIGDFSIFPTFLVSRHARRNVTVALSGDGGDELFGGYETYVAEKKAHQYARLPHALRRGLIEPLIGRLKPRPEKKGLANKAIRFMEGLKNPFSLGHTRWRHFLNGKLLPQVFTPNAYEQLHISPTVHVENLFRRAGNRSPINRGLYVDVKSYLVDNCLVKMDRMSMAASLEARVPLLDKELVEMAFQIPDDLKVCGTKTKVLLKNVAARHVPKECVYRPKEGFSIPIKNWLAKELRPQMENLLNNNRLMQQDIFEAKTVERLKAEHLSNTANHSHILWALMVFQAWHDRWLKNFA
jgi:asparagine synthase (glutamine-hydrolysing)